MLFYATEISASKPGAATITISQGHGVSPHGTFAEFADALPQAAVITASDMGYRTSPADSGGPLSYPPLVNSAFSISRSINLDPSSSVVAAAWGSINLANSGNTFDAIAATWNNDGRAARVLFGTKTREDFGGVKSGRTTTGTYLDATGAMQTAAAFVLRNEYSAVLVPNPVYYNYVPNSATLSDFSASAVTKTAAATVAPDGTTTAVKITEDTSNAEHHLTYVFTSPLLGSTSYTASAYFKAGSRSTVAIEIRVAASLAGGNAEVVADLAAGTITATTAGVTASSIVAVGSGWFRLSITATTAASPSTQPQMFIAMSNGTTTGSLSYAGTGTDFIYAWGAQLEIASAPGTYVPTSGGAASTAPTYAPSGNPALLNEAAATNYVLSTQTPSAANMTVATSTAVPARLAGQTVWQHTRTATGTDTNSGGIGVSGLPTTGGTVAASCWVWLPNPLRGKTSITANIEGNATGGVAGTANLNLRDQWQRVTATATLTAGFSTSNIVLRVSPQIAGDVFYTTAWQFEMSPAATTFIPPSTTPATRTADNNRAARGIFLDPAYSTLQPLFTGVSTPWAVSDTELQIPLRDATYWLERPIQTTQYAGTGTYEGPSAMAGLPKPKARGAVFNIGPTLIDATNLIYQYTDGPGTVQAVQEGAAITYIFASDTTNLYAGSTPAGQYRTDNSRGLFQLGSSPVGQITADVTGAFPINGVVSNPATLAKFLLLEDLSFPSAYLNTASFTAQAAAHNYQAGVYFDPSDTADGVAAVDRVLSAFGAKLFPMRDGTLAIMALRALPTTATASVTLSPDNAVSVIPRPLPASVNPPPYRVRVGYFHNYTVQTSGLLGAAPASRKQFAAASDRFAAAINTDILAAYNRPNDLAPIGGAVIGGTDAQTVANELLALWATRRRTYDVTVPLSVGIGLELGTVVNLIWPTGDLGSGKLGQIVADTFRSTDSTITLTVLI